MPVFHERSSSACALVRPFSKPSAGIFWSDRRNLKRSDTVSNDSPAGLAAEIVEKFRSWCDCDGNVEKQFTKDEILTNVMLYWATGSITSSARIYYENQRAAQDGSAGRSPNGVCGVSKGDRHPSPPVGGDALQLTALDRDASRRALCGARTAGTARRGHSGVLPGSQIGGISFLKQPSVLDRTISNDDPHARRLRRGAPAAIGPMYDVAETTLSYRFRATAKMLL